MVLTTFLLRFFTYLCVPQCAYCLCPPYGCWGLNLGQQIPLPTDHLVPPSQCLSALCVFILSASLLALYYITLSSHWNTIVMDIPAHLGVLVVLGPTHNHIELISKQDHCFRFGVWEEANFSESWCTLAQPSRGGACEAADFSVCDQRTLLYFDLYSFTPYRPSFGKTWSLWQVALLCFSGFPYQSRFCFFFAH